MDTDVLRDLRGPSAAAGGVFWQTERQLMVFDADAAAQANTDNFADLTLPDRLRDLLLRRPSTPVSWKRVRSAWMTQLRTLGGEQGLAALDARMDSLLRARTGAPVNLPWLAHEVSFRSLLPIVLDGLSTSDSAKISEDAIAKLARLLGEDAEDPPWWRSWRPVSIQVKAGLVVRRALRRRARDAGAARADLTQPIACLLDELGMDRAVDAVTAVLTAIAGPPGAAAGCVMYELVGRPDWADRLAAEFAAVSLAELYRSGTRSAPVAHRFVKEVLRRWTSPTMLTRSVRTPMRVAGHDLAVGQHFVLSPAMVHQDPRHWRDPEVFDPDRWLPGAPHGPAGGQHYVPFGWAPTACVGAGLGLCQLVLLCRLLVTTYRIDLLETAEPAMAIGPVPVPLGFDGRVSIRG
ncbi:Cytochrome P450 [Amycolatopsis xylanica]|uniref:Cytochrome P450 n=1 Tax=Amycolatopsis xylanica TaxID=589385 RepID=A0A1H3PMC5_9PSEU|nr:cytochrome P450 [Amycolatopsis xylanica]SDZ02183.1 Cytochrome P450 [Amycolatopsis xylanica]